ncbi:hypothetical protein AVEN_190317-1 [Araneus ventricosus]|uniref:Mariner Mos1 transposase n=1 Tax=Araneus ventricosus TaxID=182803 RepID=A0A4Y2Q8W3_ARAVE|nr:hypothetical protein AVEN_190317-1 [Araneus ventricosus]
MLKIKRNAAEELEALLHEGSCQTLVELAESLGVDHTMFETFSKCLKTLGMIQKQCHQVPYQLKPRNVERRLFMYERQKREEFLHRIVIGDEKWIHCDNPKRR